MKKKQKQDIFDIYGLDRENPETVAFVVAACKAGYKLYKLFAKDKEPFPAFNQFITAWQYYSIVPEAMKPQFEKKALKPFISMWNDVSASMANHFCQLCERLSPQKKRVTADLCKSCLNLLDAITVLDGKLPEATRIFEVAKKTVESGKAGADTCAALLYLLCARICYRSFGRTGKEEEDLLSEGLRCHLNAKPDSPVRDTELYAVHISGAVHDILYLKLERDETPNEQEITDLIKEGFDVVSDYDTPAADLCRKNFAQLFGVSDEEINEKTES
ncbi:MAG: hypothetical protein IKQ01_03355 [Bacteroidales bacterium]|nr:hypothetical protein [Bacteroidales bacterium]